MKRAEQDDEDVSVLPPKKRGRPVLLSEELDKKVKQYLLKVREGGGAVSAQIAIASARGILLHRDRSSLLKFEGHIQLNRHWDYSLLSRMMFVKRKAIMAFLKQALH